MLLLGSPCVFLPLWPWSLRSESEPPDLMATDSFTLLVVPLGEAPSVQRLQRKNELS